MAKKRQINNVQLGVVAKIVQRAVNEMKKEAEREPSAAYTTAVLHFAHELNFQFCAVFGENWTRARGS
jgi:uncharacterized phage infection (PIP) family protein YhgE